MECWSVMRSGSAAEASSLKAQLLQEGTGVHGATAEVVTFTQGGVGLYDREQKEGDWQKGTLQLTPLRLLFTVEDTSDRELTKFGVLFLPLNFISKTETFAGLPSLLKTWSHPKLILRLKQFGAGSSSGEVSPPPRAGSSNKPPPASKDAPYCKISFRNGGMDAFHEALKNALRNHKWAAQSEVAPVNTLQPAMHQQLLAATTAGGGGNEGRNTSPTHVDPHSASASPPPRFSTSQAGVTGLMRKVEGDAAHKQAALSDAMRDINGIMDNASSIVKEIQAMNRSLQSPTSGEAPNAADAEQLMLMQQTLGLPCPVSHNTVGGSQRAFEQEVAKELRGWLNDKKNPLHRVHVVSLIELFSRYNTARGQLDLLSPSDVKKACEFLHENYSDEFKVVMYKKSGLVVLQRVQSLSATISLLEKFLGPQPTDLKSLLALLAAPAAAASSSGSGAKQSGALRSITETQLSNHLGVSISVGRTLLEDLELEEVLCRSETVLGGLSFHWNVFVCGARS